MKIKARPLRSLLIKPTGPDCNLDCQYCFYLKKAELFNQTRQHRMSDEMQENLIKQAMEQSDEGISLAWQGGEPTLMGLDFYKRAVELEQKYGHGQQVGNGLQTNGTQLTPEWANFLKEYNWLVGISLDGPQFIHDHYRLNKAHKRTHQVVENNLKMLLEKGVSTNVLCCVTSYSVNYPEELYNYFKTLGINFMQFIPIVEKSLTDASKAADFSVSAKDYGYFLCKLFDLWLADFKNGQPTTSIRYFESVFHNYVGLESPECTLMKNCAPYVVVEHNGDVYSCDFFVEPKWKLGNIRYNKLIELLNSKKQIAFAANKAQLPRRCHQCRWTTKCYGGCIKDRIMDPNDHLQPRFCQSYQQFFEHANPILSDFATQWKLQQKEMLEARNSHGVYNATKDF